MKRRPALLLRLLAGLLTVALVHTGCGSETGPGVVTAASDGGGSADATASSDGLGTDGGSGADGTAADGTAATDGDDATTAQPKIWAIGVTTLTTKGANGRELPTEVWYPIKNGTKGEATKYMLGIVPSPYAAIRDAPAAAGSFPLIAFSHGNGGVRSQSVFLTEYLARHGYVVVAPDHVGNTTLDIDNSLGLVMSLWRPMDMKAAIDRVLNPTAKDPAWLKGLIKPGKIGVTGHSFGGYTTLALVGLGVGLPSGATIDCASKSGKPFCATQKLLGEPPFDLSDPRVGVAVPLAHALYDAGVLSHEDAKSLKIPVIMMGATGDTLTPVKKEAEPLYAALTGPTALLTIQGGDHFSFANMCELENVAPANIKTTIKALCGPGAKPSMAAGHAAIAEHALAAFDIYLKGDDSKRALLAASSDGAAGGETGVFTLKSKGIVK